jgi:replicative DNA helicase
VNMSLDVDERWHRYERRRRGEDDSVWHYPWPTIDSVTDGINPTELVLITARPGVGKTWALCCILDNLVRSGARTLLISTEMSVSAIERRIDAVHFGLDFEAFRSGLLPDHLTKKYREGLEEFRSLSNAPIVVGDEVLTPAAIDAKYQQYKPDVILVDGLYLLRDDEGARDLWARTTNVSRGLKVLAKRYTIPVIATTQLHRPAARMAVDRIGLDNLAYSDALSQDADVVIGMYANKNLLSEHARLLRILKAREGVAPTPTKIAFRPGADLSDITPQEGVDQEDIQADDDQVDF